MDFTTDAIRLSLRNAETGKPLEANVYNVQFDDGTSRVMSIGQLVMAICLARATEMESKVVDIMGGMANTTANIEALSDVEARIIDDEQTQMEKSKEESGTIGKYRFNPSSITGSWTVITAEGETRLCTTAEEVLVALDVGLANTVDTMIDNIEAKLDTMNTTSQEQMITLQSQTNKRDQSYEMISNVLKSMYTVMSGIVNNV